MFENSLKTIECSMFDLIRVVDPVSSEVLYLSSGELPTGHHCYDTWKNNG
ncbi:MAG: hypothetical protein RR090_11840 [Niameybacter sp.]